MGNNESGKPQIVVIGDVGFNQVILELEKKPDNEKTAPDQANKVKTFNWQNLPSQGVFKLPADALIIRELLEVARAGEKTGKELFNIVSYDVPELEKLTEDQVLTTIGTTIKRKTDDKEKIAEGTSFFYHKNFLGYTSSKLEDGVPGNCRDFNTHFKQFLQSKDMIIIDDSSNGFRYAEDAWKNIIDKAGNNHNVRLIYKMSQPLFEGPLWKTISQYNLLERTVVIIHANELREEGVNISRKLSWDSTISDFFIKFRAYSKYKELAKCSHLLVRIGMEGVMYFNDIENSLPIEDQPEWKPRDLTHSPVMFYLPHTCEDEHFTSNPGDIYELGSIFAGFLAAQLLADSTQEPLEQMIKKAIPTAMENNLELLAKGYRYDSKNNKLDYPFDLLPHQRKDKVKWIQIDGTPFTRFKFGSYPDSWSILSNQLAQNIDLNIAMKYVKTGKVPELDNVPVVKFAKLLTIDKNEIESFRSIHNLITEYRENIHNQKPLSIAVFGPPGAGKSFSINEVANSVLDKEKTVKLEYNISQLQSPLDLARAFHETRDYSLKGIIPLVFFDEFDSSYEKEPLGWLKYFLAPMQDGLFKEGEKAHPIGRAIFVFAGGTSSSLEEFSRENNLNNSSQEKNNKGFITAKGPDFISRLKGYVNILGPNPWSKEDDFYIIRRAVLLRALMVSQKNIYDEKNKNIRIDDDLLRALLLIPKYKHGSRSVDAIINMSMLRNRKTFEKAALPSLQQLNLHVDAHVFAKILDRSRFLNIVVEKLRKTIHERYVKHQLSIKAKDLTHDSMKPWEVLDEKFKKSNLAQAEDIQAKLLRINCDFRHKEPLKPKNLHGFTNDEIEMLAELEHKRWRDERISAGWKYGKERDNQNKIHPDLIPWSHLKDDIRDYDRNAIREIPDILDEAGYEIYRLDDPQQNQPIETVPKTQPNSKSD